LKDYRTNYAAYIDELYRKFDADEFLKTHMDLQLKYSVAKTALDADPWEKRRPALEAAEAVLARFQAEIDVED